MLAHVLDHFIFSSKLLTTKVKNIFFGVFAFLLLFSFWWFKGVAFGIDGPIAEYKGLQWRSVRFSSSSCVWSGGADLFGCFL